MSGRWPLALKNLLFPVFCRECETPIVTDENIFFCPTCWERPRRVESPFCDRCGHPFAGRVGFGDSENTTCADCRQVKKHWCDRIYGATVYEGAIAEAIKLLKFNQRERLVEPLAELMREFAESYMDVDHYDVLVPVPLYRVRQRDRGFNQAERLARAIAPGFPSAVVSEGLKRARPTRVQSRMAQSKERTRNMRDAFVVLGDIDLQDRSILLVDDVVTTGATVQECARMLKAAGAGSVDTLATAVARRNQPNKKRKSRRFGRVNAA